MQTTTTGTLTWLSDRQNRRNNKGSINQEVITIINTYTSNNRTQKYTKQNL